LTVRRTLLTRVPEQPARYRVEVYVHQVDGNDLVSARNPLSRVVHVVPGGANAPRGDG
jgi:hypothetical protein